MAHQSSADGATALLQDAAGALSSPSAPASLRLFARWPSALAAAWGEVEARLPSATWSTAASRIRRHVLAGVATLPHPMELQWGALKARGIPDEERVALLDLVAAYDAAMATQTLVAAFAWAALGSPDIGGEG